MLDFDVPWKKLNITKEEYYNSYCVFCKQPKKHQECNGHDFTLDMKNRFADDPRFVKEAMFEM